MCDVQSAATITAVSGRNSRRHEMKEITNRDSKSFRSFIMGAVSMFAFMIGDWLLDAAGAGDAELGLVAHTNWPGMSMWRFVASSVIAIVAIYFTYLGCREAIALSQETSRNGSAAGRIMNGLYRFCHVTLIVFGSGLHIIICMFPMIFKTVLGSGGTIELAASVANDTASLIIVPFMIVYLVCDLGVSVAWYYIVLKKQLRLSPLALLCCPLSTLLLDFALKAIPLQFFKDFTVAFESLGWLLMFTALAVHTKRSAA